MSSEDSEKKNDTVVVVTANTETRRMKNDKSEKLSTDDTSSKKKRNQNAASYSSLFRFATTSDLALNAIGFLFAAIAGGTFPITTVVFGGLINTFGKWEQAPGTAITSEELTSQVAQNTIFFLYLAAASMFSTFIFSFVFVYTAERQTHKLRSNYLAAILRQNIAWFDDVGPGEVATRITTDTFLIQDGIGEKLPMAVQHICTFLSGFIIAFYKNWRLTLVLLSVIPLIALSNVVMNTFVGRYQTRIFNMYGKAGTIAEETISAIRTVTAFGAQKKLSANYNKNLTGARNEGLAKARITGLGFSTLFFIMYCSYSVTFYYGYHLLEWNLISPGEVVNVFFAVLIGAFSLGNLGPDLEAFNLARSAAPKIFSVLDRVPPIDSANQDGKKKPAGERINGLIQLKSVKFTYPSRPSQQILHGIDLAIEPGKSVALVGTSGSGKSTIIQLIERFYDPVEGVVAIDGIPIPEYNLGWLRTQIGLVSQEPVLFEGSVAENVAFGLVGTEHENAPPEAKKELIIKACKEANAHEFIMRLPQKYDTQVGERAILLSGGQKQRIAIARAIVKDPVLLLLDEATSALDTASERIVQQALDRVSKSRTTVTIAHRLSTIKNCDLIVVMSKGEIIEKGTHESLLDQKGFYFTLVNAQALAKSESRSPLSENDIKDADALPDIETPSQDAAKAGVSSSKLDLEAGAAKEKGRSMSFGRVFLEILKMNMPEIKFIAPAVFASIAAGMIYPFFAICFASIIRVFSLKGDTLRVESERWSLYFFFLALVAFFAYLGQNLLFGLSSEYLTERIRQRLFLSILRQDIAFFDDESHATGVLTSALSIDAQRIQGVSGATLGTILQVLSTLIGGILVALVYGWKLALVATAVLPFLIMTGYMRVAIVKYFSERSRKAYEQSAQLACEAVAAVRTVQSLTREKNVQAMYNAKLEQPMKDGFHNAWSGSLIFAVASSTNFFVNAIIFWYGGHLIAYEGYSISQMFTVFVAIVFGSQGVGRLFAFVPGIAGAKESGEAILNLLNRAPAIDTESDQGKRLTSPLEGHIEFRNVKFSYPTRPNLPVLRSLNLSIKPGQFAALVGPSGCGKSTTVGLLERFYTVSGGAVLVDGEDISKLNVNDYRKQIGLVSQEPQLFDMTIRDNIAFGCETISTDEEIMAAAKDANIHDFIVSLPDGYNTMVGGKGSQLSGGQKQRIAIARALIRHPKILLLDEATSALDAESERVVQEALDAASKGRTTLTIAHRLSTIQNADIIFVFKDGAVVEEGTHKELFVKRGVYYDLVVQQDLEAKK